MRVNADPLGIQDYLRRAGRGSPRDRQPQRFTVAAADARPTCARDRSDGGGIGLTAADYLARPVRCRHRFPPAVTETIARARYRAQADAVAKQTGQRSEKSLASQQAAASEPGNPCRKAIGPKAGSGGDIDGCIARAAAKYRLPQRLLRAVVQAESGFRADAVSPAGAQGLMQLMPQTAKELGVEDPFDVAQNIDGGARYLRRMLDRFDGDVQRALAAYNAGPGAVERYQGVPPYKETRRYVVRVMDFAGRRA